MRIDGCGDFQIFFKLILPISKPIRAIDSHFGGRLPQIVLMDDSNFTLMVKFSINATMGTVAGYTPRHATNGTVLVDNPTNSHILSVSKTNYWWKS